MQFGFNQSSSFRDSKTTESEWPRIKVSKWPWPLVSIKVHLADCINQMMSQATIESEKSTISPFPHMKAKWPNLTLQYDRSRSINEQTWKGPSNQCCIPSFMVIGYSVLEKKIFKAFYHIWAWQPSWSCDPDLTNKLLFPNQPSGFQRRYCWRRHRWTMNHCLSYKLPCSFQLWWAKILYVKVLTK